MNIIDCPKCGCEYDPSGDHDFDSGEWTCEECGCKFIVEIDYEPDYSSRCAGHTYVNGECTNCGGKE